MFLISREHLATASGFQSLQFRLLENRLGLKEVKYVVSHEVIFKKRNSENFVDDSTMEIDGAVDVPRLRVSDNSNKTWASCSKHRYC